VIVKGKESVLHTTSAYSPVQEDLYKVEENLASLAKIDPPWLSAPLQYILDGGGKRLRPTLTLLSGRSHAYDLDLLLPMATAVELLHIASLVHDDTVDGSMVRRGKTTVSGLWGKNTAVLVGDYLFANAAELVSTTRNVDVMRLFAQTLMIMANSQLGESVSTFDIGQTREQYYQRIGGKTASLFSMATETGARLSGAPEEVVLSLRDYGYNLGLAFQIIDDVLDFTGEQGELGKPIGSDLAQGILTLPAIVLLERNSDDNPVRRLFKNRGGNEDVAIATETVRNSSIVQECHNVAAEFISHACAGLRVLPHDASRQALTDLAEYSVRRRK
jgi:heptaprenyl diphosphate synthase/octaprenyl-diphosphate synthase